MKARIEVIANLVVILLAIAIGGIYLRDRFSAPRAESDAIKVGDRLPRLEGWDWSAHDRTLVMVLRKGCHFCEDSAPFYQRLAARQQEGSTAAVVAVFPDTPEAVRKVVQTEGLGVHALPEIPLEKLKVSGTPSLLLVDRTGMVLNAWIGMLSPRQELDVIKAMACADNTCRQPS